MGYLKIGAVFTLCSFILIACNESDDSGSFAVFFQKADGMSTSTAFTTEGCTTNDTICTTPSAYRIALDYVDAVSCTSACASNAGKTAFSNESGSVRFLDNALTPVEIIGGGEFTSSSGTGTTADYKVLGGMTFNMEYAEADFPDSSEVEEDYRGATVRLCLKDDCVSGASRGDILVKLSGTNTFRWFNTSELNLSDTRPSSPLVDSSVASETSDEYGFLSEGVVRNVVVSSPFETSSSTDVIVKVNVEKSLACEVSLDDGICQPSIGELFWIELPSAFEVVESD